MPLSEPYLAALALLPFGACVGSFLNVVAYRLPLGMSLIDPPSHCPLCKTPIKWYDNVPVFGWLWLGGKGRCCKQPIAWRYPFVELLTGLLWAGIAFHFARAGVRGQDSSPALQLLGLSFQSGGLMLVWQGFASVLVAISLIDLDIRKIPNVLSMGGMLAGVLCSALLPALQNDFLPLFPAAPKALAGALGSLCGAGAGAGAILLISLLGTLAMRKTLREMRKSAPEATLAMGLGDVKLMAAVGAFAGWQDALLAIFVGCVYGSVVGLMMKFCTGNPEPQNDGAANDLGARLARRWNTGVSLIPFGPFLSAGALTTLFCGPQILAYWKSLVFPAL